MLILILSRFLMAPHLAAFFLILWFFFQYQSEFWRGALSKIYRSMDWVPWGWENTCHSKGTLKQLIWAVERTLKKKKKCLYRSMGQQRLRTVMGLIFSVWVYFQICFKGRPLCVELAPLLCIWINIVFSMGSEFLRELCVNYKSALAKSICLVFPGTSVSKESSHNAGDPGWIPGSRRFPGEGNGKPL